MRKRNTTDDASVGEDSFLDTTANLVGILIILVVIVGAKTKVDAEAYGRKLAEGESTEQFEEPVREARALVDSLAAQQIKLAEYELEAEYRKRERDNILQQVAFARAAVEEEMSHVDSHKREVIEKSTELSKLESALSDVNEKMGVADAAERPKIVLEHLPTPMARTVFTKEMHVQLKQGRVTVIPWDRLVDLLKSQVPLAAQRQASRNGIEDTLGPVGGFLMQYRMTPVQGGFELDRFELEITEGANSETLEQALSPTSRLQVELAARRAAETVVTVWVYPDSFAEFRTLKARLFDQGFLSAARPLPQGTRIGASPRGTRSSAQ